MIVYHIYKLHLATVQFCRLNHCAGRQPVSLGIIPVSLTYLTLPYPVRSKTSFGFIECAYLKLSTAHLLLMSRESSVPVALILASFFQA